MAHVAAAPGGDGRVAQRVSAQRARLPTAPLVRLERVELGHVAAHKGLAPPRRENGRGRRDGRGRGELPLVAEEIAVEEEECAQEKAHARDDDADD